MKKIAILLCIIIIMVLVLTPLNHEDNYIVAEEDLISKQSIQDKKILKYMEENYSINNPKIILNPYYISPLTALMIFKTPDNIDLEIKLNDEEYQTIENEKEFVIPILYLREDYNNKITLKTNNNDEYIYYLKTDKLVETDISIKATEKNQYLVSSPNSDVKHSLIDSNGNIIWYLDLDSSDFLEEYDATSFIIGVEETSSENNVSVQNGLYIIDYLGKIIKRIDSQYKYHHEVIVKDGYAYLLGTKGDIPLNLIYKMDLDNGIILDTIDIYELLIAKNPQMKPYLDSLTNGLFINSLDYLDGNILISIRNLNTIMSINMETKDINWIISSSKEIKQYYSEYLKTCDIMLLGNHHAKFIDNNTISLYNNGYDYSNEYQSTFASGIVLDISKSKVRVKANYPIKKYSYAYGSMEVGDTSLINYSYLLKDSKLTHQDPGNTYSEIVEYKKNKIITKLTIDAPIYRAKIFSIEKPKKYTIQEYAYLNNEELNLSKTTHYEKLNNILKISNNSLETTISDDTYQELIIVFKGNTKYNIKYQKTRTYFDIEDGVYDIFISMDNRWFKLDTKVKIGESS